MKCKEVEHLDEFNFECENKSCKTWNTYNIYIDFSWGNISALLLLLVKTWLGFGGVREFWHELNLYIYCTVLFWTASCVFITVSEDTLELFYLKGSVEPDCLLTVKCRSSHHLLQQSVEFAALRLVGSHMVAVSTKSISSSKLSRTTSTLKMVLFTHKFPCDCQAVILRVLISRVDLGKRAQLNVLSRGRGGGASDISRSFLVSCLSHRDRFPSAVCQQRSHSNRFTFCPPSLKQWRSQQWRSVHSPTVCCAWVSSDVTRSKLG